MMKLISYIMVLMLLMLCACGKRTETEDSFNDITNSRDVQAITDSGTMLDTPKLEETPESFPSQEETPVSVMQVFRSVLLNEATLSCTNLVPYNNTNVVQKCNGLLNELSYGFDDNTAICRFAIVDMDGDSVPEVILEIEEYCGFVILRYKEGQIYGNVVNYKAMYSLNENGAFCSMNSAFEGAMEKLYFVGDTLVRDHKIYLSYETYYINDILVSESDYNKADALFEKIPEVEWHEYTEKAVNEFLAESSLSAEIPTELEDRVRERQAYLDSLLYLVEMTYDYTRKGPEEFSADAQSYYNGCYEEMEKIYQLCQEKLSGVALEALAAEQQNWEDGCLKRLEEQLNSHHVTSMDELEDKSLYYEYGDMALRRTFGLINLYYGVTFYNWVES